MEKLTIETIINFTFICISVEIAISIILLVTSLIIYGAMCHLRNLVESYKIYGRDRINKN